MIFHNGIDDFSHLFRFGLFNPFAPMNRYRIIAHCFQDDTNKFIAYSITLILIKKIIFYFEKLSTTIFWHLLRKKINYVTWGFQKSINPLHFIISFIKYCFFNTASSYWWNDYITFCIISKSYQRSGSLFFFSCTRFRQ